MDSTMSDIAAQDASGITETAVAVRVSVVDDNDEFVALMEDLLGGRFRVTGILPRTITEFSATDPDLVFVDVFVRNDHALGGWELIDLARRDRRLRNVPIILCTGEVGPDLVDCRACLTCISWLSHSIWTCWRGPCGAPWRPRMTRMADDTGGRPEDGTDRAESEAARPGE